MAGQCGCKVHAIRSNLHRLQHGAEQFALPPAQQSIAICRLRVHHQHHQIGIADAARRHSPAWPNPIEAGRGEPELAKLLQCLRRRRPQKIEPGACIFRDDIFFSHTRGGITNGRRLARIITRNGAIFGLIMKPDRSVIGEIAIDSRSASTTPTRRRIQRLLNRREGWSGRSWSGCQVLTVSDPLIKWDTGTKHAQMR